MRTALFLFGCLNDDDVRWMANTGEVSNVRAGEMMIRKGDPPSGMFIVTEGVAHVLGVAGETIARCDAGETVGEMSFIDSRPASTTVIAAEPLRALWISLAKVSKRLDEDHPFAARFYKGLAILVSHRLREARSGSTGDQLDLDDLVLGTMTRAGDRFHLLTSYLRTEAH